VNLYLKNTSNSPLSLTYIKPISSSLYNPYSNTIFKTTKTDHNNMWSYPSSKNNLLISCAYDMECNNQWNDLVSIYDISQDSAISMNADADLQNSIIKSENLFHSFTEQSDSGVDITKSNLSSAIFMSNKHSIPTISTTINNKNVKFHISENSLFDNEISLYESMLNFPDKSDNLKLSLSCEKNNDNPCVSPMSNNALSLKYRKNIHYVQNNTTKTKLIPKRYIKWRKTNSCTFVHKMATFEKYKFMTRSYPNILKHNDEQYSDIFLHNALGKKKHLSKSYTSIFSKISHFSFCPIFSDNKQDISISSCYCPPEKILFKKKYTSLSKSFPMAKISNIKHSLRNTSVFDGKSNNVSTQHDMKTECTDLKTLKDKSISVVFIFLFLFVCLFVWKVLRGLLIFLLSKI